MIRPLSATSEPNEHFAAWRFPLLSVFMKFLTIRPGASVIQHIKSTGFCFADLSRVVGPAAPVRG